jgi:DNA-binding transcriptional ArsR family regulator
LKRREVPEAFWATLAARLLHPYQVQIVEAMRWIGHPLSASDLVLVFDRELRLSAVSYHLRRLNALGVLTLAAERVPARGSVEKFYELDFDEG